MASLGFEKYGKKYAELSCSNNISVDDIRNAINEGYVGKFLGELSLILDGYDEEIALLIYTRIEGYLYIEYPLYLDSHSIALLGEEWSNETFYINDGQSQIGVASDCIIPVPKALQMLGTIIERNNIHGFDWRFIDRNAKECDFSWV